MAVSIASLNISLTAITEPLSKGIEKAQKQIKDFADDARKALSKPIVGGADGAAGAAMSFADAAERVTGISFSAAGAVDLLAQGFQIAKQAIADSMQEIERTAMLAQTLGIATEQLIGFQHAAEMSNIGAESFNKMLEKMVRSLGEIRAGGGKGAAEALQRIGLNSQQIASMGTGPAFEAIAEAISKIENPADRAAAATAIFGKSGMELLPVLEQGKAGLAEAAAEAERLGIVFNDMDAAKVMEANDAIDRLKISLKGMSNEAAIMFAPMIEQAAKLTEKLTPLLTKIMEINAAVISGDWSKLALDIAGVKLEPPEIAPPDLLAPDAGDEAAGKKGKDPFIEGMETAREMAEREMERLGEGIRRALENARTPAEEFAAKTAEIQRALEGGAISLDEARQAWDLAAKEFKENDPAEKAKEDFRKQMEKNWEEQKRKAEEVRKSVRLPDEIFSEKIQELKKLGLDPTTFGRAANEAFQDMKSAFLAEQDITFGNAGALEKGSAEAFSAINAAVNQGKKTAHEKAVENYLKTIAQKVGIPQQVINSF